MNNQDAQSYTNNCHTSNGCNSRNNNSCQIQRIMNNVKKLEFQLTQHMCMNTALTTQMAMQLQQIILLKQATYPPTMQWPGQQQPFNHGLYMMNPRMGPQIPTSFHIPPLTFQPNPFMNYPIGPHMTSTLQQPPPPHHQIPSFNQPPIHVYPQQINNHLSGPGLPPPTYAQSSLQIRPPTIHTAQTLVVRPVKQNIETSLPTCFPTGTNRAEHDRSEKQTSINTTESHLND